MKFDWQMWMVAVVIILFFSVAMFMLKRAELDYNFAKQSFQYATLSYNMLSSGNITLAKDIVFDCASQRNLSKGVACLNEHVKVIFNYNISNQSELSFEQLIQRGGDCRHWSVLYKDLAIQLGYSAKTVITPEGSHMFAIISNEDGYCIVDQLRYSCSFYGKPERNDST